LPASLLQETGRWQMSFVPEQEDVAAVTLYAMNDGTHLYLAIDNPNDTTDDSWDQAGVYFDDNPLPSDGQWTNTICGNQDGEGNFWVMTDTVKYREWIVGPTTCDVIDPAPGTLGAVGHSSGHAQAEVAMDLTLSALRAAPGDTINMRLWIYDYSTGSFGGVWPPNSSYLDPSTYGPLTLDSGSGTQPPAAPSNLSATAVSQTQINLSWTDNSSNEDGFKIERSPDGTSGWTQIATVGANTTTYSNTSLACNTTYHYRVRAYEGSDNSGYSNTDSATTDACGGCEDTYEPDNAYSEANVIAANGVAQTHNFHVAGDIDWVKFTATAGRVYTITTSNLDSGNDTYLYLHDTDGTTVLESNDDCPGGGLESCINNWTAPSNATYYVKVHQYYSSGGCTGYGYDLGVVGSSSSGAPPAAPSNLSATAVSQTQINLSWTDNSSNEDGFEIERSPNGTSSWTQIATPVANTTSYSNTGLLCNTTYYYRVRAYNGSGYSSYSNASATTSTCGSCEDTYEPDNEYTAAELITVNGAAQTHNFHVAGDEDWVQFTALASKPYTITTSNLDSGNDTYLYLYDTDGTTVLESNDDCKGSTTLLDLSSCINNWSAPVDGTYYVKVRYYDNSEGGCAGYGYDLAISDGASPAAPGWLTATPVSQDEIDLTWTDNSDNEDGFNIERSSGTSGWTEIATVGANTATYADSNDLSPNTTYNYRVNAYNGSGYSHYSNTASTAISASVSSSSVYLPLIMRNSQ
jgi:fibronectin type 3 domain-containing protein